MKPPADKFKRLEEISKLGKGSLLNSKVTRLEEDLSGFSETLESYIALKAISKAVEDRIKVIKEALHGATVSSGSQTVDGNKVYRSKRESSAPDNESLKALMHTRGLDISQAFDTIQVLKLNPSKLQYLIDTGKLDAADVSKLHTITWAIEVEPSEDLKSELNRILKPAPKEKKERKSSK